MSDIDEVPSMDGAGVQEPMSVDEIIYDTKEFTPEEIGLLKDGKIDIGYLRHIKSLEKTKYTLISSDGDKFVFNMAEIEKMPAISAVVVDLDLKDDDETPPEIPVPIDGENLTKIKEAHDMFRNENPELTPEREQKFKEDPLTEQETNFLDMPLQKLFNLIIACNFLNFKQFSNLLAKAVAELIKGKTDDEIKIIFEGTEADFTKDEIEQALKEEPWLFKMAKSEGLLGEQALKIMEETIE